MEVGLRVVRGPDWKWDHQDGGEGHVGTLVELGKSGSITSPALTVVVQWDSGSRTNYRVGYLGAYDLRVLDNAPLGVKHPNIICDNCRKHGITGFRWNCLQCYDFDLCTQCYMSDKHDLSHPFARYETASSARVEMPKRQGAVKIQAKGIFSGAKVVRGPDWDWNNQDGGEGKVGRVVDIRGWDNESSRSVANVTWSSGSTNVYRIGHKGKVDLKCVQPASGGYYYRDHLPILGQPNVELTARITPVKQFPSTHSIHNHQFNVGDKVKVLLDVDTLRSMQEGHGGWNPRMTEFIGKVGTVHRVTDKGDIRVQYEGCNNRWTFHPAALTKVMHFSVGDMVKILDDQCQVMELQKDHGEWIAEMNKALGKLGKVIKVYLDGDLRVAVDGHTWTFNPLCVLPVPGSVTELNNTMTSHRRDEHHSHPHLGALLNDSAMAMETMTCDNLVSEAAKGHLENVKHLLTKYPKQVDLKSSGKTALQVACHQGYIEIVQVLVEAGADVGMEDDDGDTALHYSAFGNQPELMEYLLLNGADINGVNKARCSPLHVAVNKQHIECVRVLLKYNCDVNIQDTYGDTALHDAIGKENAEVIDLLVNVPEIDFTLQNKRGFNVLHHAALKGNAFATERLIANSRQIVDGKKDDGFAALHLAALNGHFRVAEILLTQGQCEIDIKNNRKQTPLLLAVNQGHCNLVELLVTIGANVNAADEDGDTALHLALLKSPSSSSSSSLQPFSDNSDCPLILSICKDLYKTSTIDDPSKMWAAMAVFLAQRGANLNLPNYRNKTPLDLATSPMIKVALQAAACTQQGFFSELRPLQNGGDNILAAGTSSLHLNVGPECIVCCDLPANVYFEPCGHCVACVDCCIRMKKCTTCHKFIEKKLGPDGQVIVSKARQASAEHLRYLENKIQEFEEAQNCTICMEQRKDVVFLCGHAACTKCSQTLRTCHMCRKPITKKINMYT